MDWVDKDLSSTNVSSQLQFSLSSTTDLYQHIWILYSVHLDTDNNKEFVVDWLQHMYQMYRREMIDKDLLE